MRTILIILSISLIAGSGCQVIPTDMFPKVTWYWSQEAKQYRQDRKNDNPEKHQ